MSNTLSGFYLNQTKLQAGVTIDFLGVSNKLKLIDLSENFIKLNKPFLGNFPEHIVIKLSNINLTSKVIQTELVFSKWLLVNKELESILK
jgi:hypothetical protein